MAITNSGILELRDYIKNNWRYLALEDVYGVEILRVELEDEDYIDVTNSGFTIHKVFTGQDIGVGKTITKATLYNSESALEAKSIALIEQAKINTTQDTIEIDIAVNIGGR